MAGKKGMRLRTWGTLRRLPSGKWHASYIGPDLARHVGPITYTAKMDAEHWLADERRSIERDEWTSPAHRKAQTEAQSVTVAAFAKQWIDERNLKPRTAAGYLARQERLAASPLGALPLRQLTPESVRTWHAQFDKTKPAARALAYQFLHAVCATAVTDGLLATNPCNIPKAMTTTTKRQAKILEPRQVAALADAMEPKRLRTMVLLMAWCGPRWGETIELRRGDINADCSVLTIGRGAVHRDGKCHVDAPKSGKGRTVVVPPHIRDDLKWHLAKHVAEGADALLFPAAQGGCHFNDKVFRDYYAVAQKAVGVDGVTVHDLRHFAGTQTARVGNLVETMGRLGHSTVKASLIYQQIVSGRDTEVAVALSALATANGQELAESADAAGRKTG